MKIAFEVKSGERDRDMRETLKESEESRDRGINSYHRPSLFIMVAMGHI